MEYEAEELGGFSVAVSAAGAGAGLGRGVVVVVSLWSFSLSSGMMMTDSAFSMPGVLFGASMLGCEENFSALMFLFSDARLTMYVDSRSVDNFW